MSAADCPQCAANGISSTSNTFFRFGPDPPPSEIQKLPADGRIRDVRGDPVGGDVVWACLDKSRRGALTDNDECDYIIAGAGSGGSAGLCSLCEYKCSSYCACVNSVHPCPHLTSAACTNSAYAYLPRRMTEPTGGCTPPVCVNILEVGGSQNVVTASQQCGVFTTVQNIISVDPKIAVITLVLVIILALVLVSPVDDRRRQLPFLPDLSAVMPRA